MRIGKDPIQIIWQGAPPHGRELVGRRARTIALDKRRIFAEVGCVVTGIAMAQRFLGVRAGAMPLDVQAKGLAAGCWNSGSSSVNILNLAKANSLRSDGDFNGPNSIAPIEEIKKILEACIVNDGVALLHVDYDSQFKNGDPLGEHWGVCYAINQAENKIFIADPATAKTETLKWDSLEGFVNWSKIKRRYVAVRIITLYPDC